MYDPAIATEHNELVSVEHGSHVDVCGHFRHRPIAWTYVGNSSKTNGNPQKRSIDKIKFKSLLESLKLVACYSNMCEASQKQANVRMSKPSSNLC
jgi:hypothetical protein